MCGSKLYLINTNKDLHSFVKKYLLFSLIKILTTKINLNIKKGLKLFDSFIFNDPPFFNIKC